jgi:hypothetical protein
VRWQFIEVPFFMRRRDEHFVDDEDFADFQHMLAANPKAGDEIQGSGGLRKARWSDRRRGKGKRGGFRIIYLVIAFDIEATSGVIFLLHIYAKGAKDDLTAVEKKTLKELSQSLKGEVRRRRAGFPGESER